MHCGAGHLAATSGEQPLLLPYATASAWTWIYAPSTVKRQRIEFEVVPEVRVPMIRYGRSAADERRFFSSRGSFFDLLARLPSFDGGS